MPRLSKIGAAALAAFGWTGLQTVTADYLVVAGGGGGGGATTYGGGGGAGGFRNGTTSLNSTLSYTVTVGSGGSANTSGGDSSFSSITSTGGGRGGGQSLAAATGGSGGGGSYYWNPTGAAGNTPSTSPSQGNSGGDGYTGIGSPFTGGGGGGAGAAGSTYSGSVGGAGGIGATSSISGTSTYYAGGGGGASGVSTGGAGGAGGGGTGSGNGGAIAPIAGTANTGGGGGGGGYTAAPGGSGVVIISYTGPQQFGGGVVTSSGGKTIHTFTTSGTLSPITPLSASYLIVAGGGGGGTSEGGGGGAGGMQTGSSLTIDKNSIYAVTVGAGGAGAANGTNSSFSLVSTASVGGGGGGTSGNGSNGGSGGGGGANGSGTTSGGTATSGQGNAGGTGAGVSSNRGAGGGGGAGAVGGNGTGSSGGIGGAGGNGLASSITGSSVTYAGGGGGNSQFAAGSYTASGGTGGGGTGGNTNALIQATNGTTNLGGGGGGGSYNGYGGLGGSGVVIISYPGSTQQMAGGTVTVSGGNVIHTFTSSGYLTPIVLVTKSLRFRSSASAYLNRTPTSAGNAQKFTVSCWVKLGSNPQSSAQITFLNAGNGSQTNSTNDEIQLRTDGTALQVGVLGQGGTGGTYAQFTPYYRDYASWYHVVVAIDTTQATQANRCRAYINGVEQTAYVVNGFTLNYSFSYINSTSGHLIGRNNEGGGPVYTDAYFAEYNFIDGQALTPNSFGTLNDLGIWQPIRYGGSYGTNGFYLPFTNTTSTTTLVADSSPNGNNWTPNNISLTAGSTYDSMTDVPTLTSATVANYATLNPLDNVGSTFSNGNLSVSVGAGGGNLAFSSIGITTGKFYWEVTPTSSAAGMIGIADANSAISTRTFLGANAWYYYNNGQKYNNGTGTAYGAAYVSGDIIGIALDMDAGTLTFYKNNVSQGVAYSGLTGKTMIAALNNGGSGAPQPYDTNFGQRPFAYTPPTGFVAMNTFNLPTPTIGATASTQANDYFNAITYTGNGTSGQSITGVGFQPDFVWVKSRSNAIRNNVYDVVRGANKLLFTDGTFSEFTNDSDGYLSAFNADGFTATAGAGTINNINASGYTYVAWNWKANGTGVTNTAGSITSTVSANTTAGFSVVTYTGTGVTGTLGHGLGIAPAMIIVKSRSNASNWYTYHQSIGNTGAVALNLTNATITSANFWNNTSPTSSVFTASAGSAEINGNGLTYVAYCFAQIAGYSAFGSYTGNGSSDGPFIFTGFRPEFVMIKNASAVTDWKIMDAARNLYNPETSTLAPNTSGSEDTNSSYAIDYLSNGFKIRNTFSTWNGSGNTLIYMAFAESPFKYANAR